MGALTSKAYSFKYRNWELSKKTSIDLTTPFGYKVVVQKRGNEILRILPLVNYAHNEELITNQSRFNFDAEKQNRIKVKLKKYFIKNKKALTSVYKPISTKNVLKTLNKINLQTSNLQIVLGKFIDTESSIAFKEFININKISEKTYLSSSEEIDNNFDFRASYMNQIDLKAFTSCDAIFLIGCNPVIEEPLIGLHIKRAFHERSLPIYTFGAIRNAGFNTINLGNDITRLINISLGKDKFCKKFLNIKKPLILIGNTIFENKDAKNTLNLLKTLYSKLSLIRFLPKTQNNHLLQVLSNDPYQKLLSYDFWNGFCYSFKNVNTLNALEVGAKLNDKITFGNPTFIKPLATRKNPILYLVGADEIKVNNEIYNFVVYQGTHGGLGAFQADLILPTVTPLSYSALYVNMFGQYNFTKKLLEKFSNSKSNMFYPIYMSLNFAKSNINNSSNVLPNHFFTKFRFKAFRYMLLNRLLGISNNTFYLISPFYFLQLLGLVNNNSIINLLKSELENSTIIEFLAQKLSIRKNSSYNLLTKFRHNFAKNETKKKKRSYGVTKITIITGISK